MADRRSALERLLAAGALLAAPAWPRLAQAQPAQAGVASAPLTQTAKTPLAPRTLVFPRDHGAHPELRTEWWYLTGELAVGGGGPAKPDAGQAPGARRFGFQLTFFRSRVDATRGMASAFAARQLLFAHAALTDVAGARLLHDQRIARAGFGVARASETDTDLRLRDWTLRRQPEGRYEARLEGGDFALALQASPTQPLLLQGQAGLSRKGPQPAQASYYYSQPQLQVQGRLRLGTESLPVTGRAWLDHEWSEEVLHPDAVGWDWVGMNLADGSALTAFRLRRADGSALWAGGSWRAANGSVRAFGPDEVRMTPGRTWTSPLTGTAYPVAWTLETPAGRFGVEAVVDAQELDSRRSTGTVYWEGLSVLKDAAGRTLGRGYLELTGYGRRLAL